MRAGVYRGERDVRVQDVPDPVIEAPTDAIVRIVRSSVCGSDLWPYRGISPSEPGARTGHELTGIVEEVGADVTRVAVGDLVVAPFAYGDGTCEQCRAGLWTSCVRGGVFGGDSSGGQAEYARVPWADANLWVAPPDVPEERLDGLHLLTDVLLTGYHAAVLAGVGEPVRRFGRADGSSDARSTTVAVVGDGAVGLCGVICARLLGAEQVIAIGHHHDRLEVARRLGASDVLDGSGGDLAERVADLTGGGATSVLECVGTTGSHADAAAIARPGGRIGSVGVPAGVKEAPMGRLFSANLNLAMGVAPTRAYVETVGPRVASGEIDPSPVATDHFPLDQLPDAFAAMDERRAIKAIVLP